MQKARLIVLLALVCVFAMSIPAFAQLASGNWPKYQRDAYNSGRSPATKIAKPVVDWSYDLGYAPTRFGMAIDGQGNAYVMPQYATATLKKIGPTGSLVPGFSWAVPSTNGGTSANNRVGPVLYDNGANQYVLSGPGRSAGNNCAGYTHGGDPITGALVWTGIKYKDYYTSTSNSYSTPAVGEDGSIYAHTMSGTVDQSGPIFGLNGTGGYRWMYNSFTVSGTTYKCGIGGSCGTFPVKRIPAAGEVPAHNRIFISGGDSGRGFDDSFTNHRYQVFAIDDMGDHAQMVWGSTGMNAFGPGSISNDGQTLYVSSSDNWGTYDYVQPPRSCPSRLSAYDVDEGGRDPIDGYYYTGDRRWSIDTGTQHVHPPAIGEDGTLYLASVIYYDYFSSNLGRVCAITDNGTSASIKWSLDLPDDGFSECSNVVVASTDPQVIYVGVGGGGLPGGRVYAIADMGDHAEILWTYQGIAAAETNAWPQYLALTDDGDLLVEFCNKGTPAASGNSVKKFSAGTGFDVADPNGISGYVRDSAGNPIANAWVAASTSAEPLVCDSARIRTRTNADGYYQLGVMSTGTYYVAATAPGYNGTADQTATLTSTADVEKLDFTLQTAGFNQALFASVSCPGYYEPCPPSNAVDGNLGDMYANGTVPAAFVIDLGSAKSINELAVYWERGYANTFTIDYSSDGSNWSNAKTVGGTNGGFPLDYYINTNTNNTTLPRRKTGYQVFKFAAQTAQYWRINTTSIGTDSGSSLEVIYELELRDSTKLSVPQTVGGAKSLDDGDPHIINSAVVTATADGGGTPTDNIFVESADQAAGIRVHKTGGIPSTISFGDKVYVGGRVQTDANGERYVEATTLTRLTSTQSPDGPALVEAGMNNATAEADLSQGLFVKIWGTLSTVGGEKFITDGTVANGSAAPIKLLNGSVALPADGSYIRVRGVMGKDADGTVLYMRNERADWAYGADSNQALPLTGQYDYPIQCLVLGPFTDGSKQDYELLDEAFITESMQPTEGEVTAGKTWTVATSADGILNLNAIFGGAGDHSVAYVHLYVWSETASPAASIVTGSDDWLKVIVNGTELYSRDEVAYPTGRGCTIGQDGVDIPPTHIPLVQGLNSIMFKVANGTGGFGLSSQIVDDEAFGATGYGGFTPYVSSGLGYSLNP